MFQQFVVTRVSLQTTRVALEIVSTCFETGKKQADTTLELTCLCLANVSATRPPNRTVLTGGVFKKSRLCISIFHCAHGKVTLVFALLAVLTLKDQRKTHDVYIFIR